MWHDGWYGYHMGWWGAGIMGFVILCAILIVFLRGGSDDGSPPEDSALDILKRRYAAGELSEAEFTRMRDELTR